MSLSLNKALTLRQRVIQSSSWTLLGYGVNQFLRLAGNLILTRLLFPEAFGLMAIIQTIYYGANMVSDMGIGASIVRHEHGDTPVFLNTAWTVQIVRGILVWAAFCVIAWPVSKIYTEPLLAIMLPIAGLDAIIGGFLSTKIFTANRNMEAKRVTQIEVGSNLLGLIITALLAWLLHSVWALVWGGMLTTVIRVVASHTALHGIRNQFAWDRDSLHHMRGFGRWIMLSSALTFVSMEGARLLIGAIIDMKFLALYTLANTMSLVFWQAMQQVAGKVFFPAYSEVFRKDRQNLSAVLYKTRLTMVLPSWILAVFFIFFGSHLMGLLYDSRYQASGIMLEKLAVGSLVACIWGSYSGVLLALGEVVTMTALTGVQIILQIAMIFIGYHYGGYHYGKGSGLVLGIAVANWMVYPFYALVFFRHGLLQYKLDLAMLTFSALIVVMAWPHLV